MMTGNFSESVVAESVVVIRKLLQLEPSHVKDIVVQLAKLVDIITVPNATASILWLLGEYSETVPLIAPDVLRKMAKQFPDLDPGVKLQTMNLAVKLFLTNPQQTGLLTQYVLNMAKYDMSYDIRDRARFLRAFIFPEPGTEDNRFVKEARKIFLSSKPPPLLESRFVAELDCETILITFTYKFNAVLKETTAHKKNNRISCAALLSEQSLQILSA